MGISAFTLAPSASIYNTAGRVVFFKAQVKSCHSSAQNPTAGT
jgi:hypothetical protein